MIIVKGRWFLFLPYLFVYQRIVGQSMDWTQFSSLLMVVMIVVVILRVFFWWYEHILTTRITTFWMFCWFFAQHSTDFIEWLIGYYSCNTIFLLLFVAFFFFDRSWNVLRKFLISRGWILWPIYDKRKKLLYLAITIDPFLTQLWKRQFIQAKIILKNQKILGFAKT